MVVDSSVVVAALVDSCPDGEWAPLADRCWERRDNVTTYDAASIALAEQLHATLATLDARLARSSGPRCESD